MPTIKVVDSLGTAATPNPWEFWVANYDAAGDGTTDDTAAINDAVAAAVTYAQAHTNYAEIIFEPDKVYLVAGATTQGGATFGNAQIPLPVIPTTDEKLVLAFRGLTADSTGTMHWQQTVPQAAGAVLKSTLSAATDPTYGEPSVIGGPTPQQGYGTGIGNGSTFTNLHVIIDGLTIQVPNNPSVCGIDLRGVGNASVPNAAVMVDAAPTSTITHPTNAWQFGLAMPTDNNNALATVGNYTAYGQNFGIITSEHTSVDTLRTIFCIYGIVHRGGSTAGPSSTAHAAHIRLATVEACWVALGFMDTFPAKLVVDVLDWEPGWDVFYVINDPTNVGMAEVGFNEIGVSTAESNFMNGGANVSVRLLHRPLGAATAPAVPATTVPLRNPFYRDCAVTITGGTVSAVKVDGVTLGVTSGTVIVPTCKNIELDYTAAPTWAWITL